MYLHNTGGWGNNWGATSGFSGLSSYQDYGGFQSVNHRSITPSAPRSDVHTPIHSLHSSGQPIRPATTNGVPDFGRSSAQPAQRDFGKGAEAMAREPESVDPSIIDPVLPPMTTLSRRDFKTHKATMHWYDPDTREWKTRTADVLIDLRKPFNEGSCRTVYRMRELATDTYYAVKIAKTTSTPRNEYFTEACYHAKVARLAERFSQAMAAPAKQAKLEKVLRKVEYVRAYVMDVPSMTCPVTKKPLVAAAEIMLTSKFRKYTNNYGFVHPKAHCIPLAFSHWTWSYSRGDFLVCDVQGVVEEDREVYTDPQLLSNHPMGVQWGRCDLGAAGVQKFFETHKCNRVCQMLGITQNRPVDESVALQAEIIPKPPQPQPPSTPASTSAGPNAKPFSPTSAVVADSIPAPTPTPVAPTPSHITPATPVAAPPPISSVAPAVEPCTPISPSVVVPLTPLTPAPLSPVLPSQASGSSAPLSTQPSYSETRTTNEKSPSPPSQQKSVATPASPLATTTIAPQPQSPPPLLPASPQPPASPISANGGVVVAPPPHTTTAPTTGTTTAAVPRVPSQNAHATQIPISVPASPAPVPQLQLGGTQGARIQPSALISSKTDTRIRATDQDTPGSPAPTTRPAARGVTRVGPGGESTQAPAAVVATSPQPRTRQGLTNVETPVRWPNQPSTDRWSQSTLNSSNPGSPQSATPDSKPISTPEVKSPEVKSPSSVSSPLRWVQAESESQPTSPVRMVQLASPVSSSKPAIQSPGKPVEDADLVVSQLRWRSTSSAPSTAPLSDLAPAARATTSTATSQPTPQKPIVPSLPQLSTLNSTSSTSSSTGYGTSSGANAALRGSQQQPAQQPNIFQPPPMQSTQLSASHNTRLSQERTSNLLIQSQPQNYHPQTTANTTLQTRPAQPQPQAQLPSYGPSSNLTPRQQISQPQQHRPQYASSVAAGTNGLSSISTPIGLSGLSTAVGRASPSPLPGASGDAAAAAKANTATNYRWPNSSMWPSQSPSPSPWAPSPLPNQSASGSATPGGSTTTSPYLESLAGFGYKFGGGYDAMRSGGSAQHRSGTPQIGGFGGFPTSGYSSPSPFGFGRGNDMGSRLFF